LEDALGFDPFDDAVDTKFPVTFGDFDPRAAPHSRGVTQRSLKFSHSPTNGYWHS
jgi:hypothetical protein